MTLTRGGGRGSGRPRRFMCGLTSTGYKEKIGLKCQFLIEPKPKEPCKHQYDYGTVTLASDHLSPDRPLHPDDATVSVDAMSVIGFLNYYGLDGDFKLNIEPNHTTLAGHSYEHDIVMASA